MRAQHLCACSLTSVWDPFTCEMQQDLPVEDSLLEEPLRDLDSVWSVKVLRARWLLRLSVAHMHTCPGAQAACIPSSHLVQRGSCLIPAQTPIEWLPRDRRS